MYYTILLKYFLDIKNLPLYKINQGFNISVTVGMKYERRSERNFLAMRCCCIIRLDRRNQSGNEINDTFL